MKFKSIILSFFGILLLVVFLQNMQTVALRFLFWEFRMSQILLLPLIMIIGGVIGFIIGRKSWDW